MYSDEIKNINRIKLNTVAESLKKRQINAYYAEDEKEAKEIALSFVNDGDIVSGGGSVTISKLGIFDAVRERNIECIDCFSPEDPEEKHKARVKALSSDVYYLSANAITMDGCIVNIDGTGNRMAAMCYGPRKVVIIAGANKIVADEEAAVKRIKTDACPPNCYRLGKKTPCALTGKCGDCLIPEVTSCCMTVVTRFCTTGRLHVILVNEELGF